jgi:PAS domain S-box-containing protein
MANRLESMPFESLESILDSIPSAIVIANVNGKFLYVNQRGIDLYGFNFAGFDLDEHLGKVKALKPDGTPYPPEEMPIYNSVKHGIAIRNVEMSIERENGQRLPVTVSSAPLFNAKKNVIAAIVIFEDITDRKQAEQALKESEERYRTLVDTITDAIIVHDNGRILYANPAALKLFGVETFEELTAKDMSNFMAPTERNDIQKRITHVIQGQKVLPQEETVVRLDGKHVPVEVLGAPIRYGGQDAILGIFRNITQRKEMSKKLAEYAEGLEKEVEVRTKEIIDSQQYLRNLYESFGEAFIGIDWELNVIYWNKTAERVTTVKEKDALGKKVYDVLPEMVSIDFTPFLETLRQQKPARFMMNTVSRETKKPAIFEISTYPSAQGIIIIVEDKTEEEQTKRLSAIGATAGMVGHDIRNPLQAMVSDVYLLKDYLLNMPESQTKTDVTESLDGIERNIGYINKIVADLQDYARPLNPECTEVNLYDLITNVFQPIAIPDNISPSIDIDPSVKLLTDPTLLRRIFTNLFINAIQAMPHGGKLVVSASQKDDKATICVDDTGVGIPEEVKSKLFTPMITTKAKGQGLGLAVVKRLVEALEGSISFESEVGKGTRFIIVIPIKNRQCK